MKVCLQKIFTVIDTGDLYKQEFVGYPSVCAVGGSTISMGKDLGYRYTEVFYRFANGQGEMNYRLSDFERIYRIVKERLQNDSAYLTDLENIYNKAFLKHQPTFDLIVSQELPSFSDADFVFILKDMFCTLNDSVGVGHILESVGQKIEDDLRKILSSRKFEATKLEEYIAILSTPAEPSWIKIEENDLINISALSLDKQERALGEHFRKWFWIKTNYANPGNLTIEYFRKRLSEVHGRDIFSCEKCIVEKESLIRELGLEEQSVFLIRILEQVARWQDNRKANIYKAFDYTFRFLKKLSFRLAINDELLRYLVPSDVEGVKSLKDLSALENQLIERVHGVYIYQDSSECLVVGSNVKVIDKYRESLETKKVEGEGDVLSGQIAYRGKVRGVVRVVHDPRSEKGFAPGDVLVTSMTRPEFVPLMERAVAVVTNEGGITSHAAIVAREMKKPCIIGTKIATKVLKDGDLVEVDAEKGIVKILKRG